jgi:RNA polymerase sigma factor (sigma-70 family)
VKSLTDNDIMEQVRDGQIEKTAILFERHHVRMFNFFLRLTGSAAISEDLVQEVFLRILKYRTTYQGQSKFSVWLYQIARNAHIDNLRKQKSTFPIDDQFEEPETEDRSPGEFYEQKQDAALVQEALRRLPLKKREVLILSRYQNMKYKDIAELFGCHVGTIKAHVHRAVKELGRIYFELQGGTP